MSQLPNQYQPQIQYETASSPGKGLAISSLVLGCLGIIPLLGVLTALVGLILGIVALSKSQDKKGLAVAGTTVSAITLVLACVISAAGILLPALGKARQAAQQIKSSVQMSGIAQGLKLYAMDNKDKLPEPGADWESRLVNAQLVSREMLTSPRAKGSGDISYFYVPDAKPTFTHDKVLLIENPDLYLGRGGNVCYQDGQVDYLTGDDFWAAVDKAKATGAAVPFVRSR
jgi:hypothetical protein